MQMKDVARRQIGKIDWSNAFSLPALLVVVVWLGIQWLTLGVAPDAHWTTSWPIFSIALFLLHWSRTTTIQSFWAWLWGVVILMLLFSLGEGRSVESAVMHVLIWSLLFFRTTIRQSVLDCMTVMFTALIVSCSIIFLSYAFAGIFAGTWSHGSSYAIPLPWAHRNIAIESLVILGYAVSQTKRRRTAVLIVLLGLLAVVYQARAAMLAIAVWSMMLAFGIGVSPKHFRSFLALGIGGFFVLQLVWLCIPVSTRVVLFADSPDILKSLDICYNLAQAQSSSERRLLWSWTVERLSLFGPGSGEWKWMAEFEVNNILNKCNVAIRRAHSDVLQTMFELGVVPFLILGCLSFRQCMYQWRAVLVLLPILMFSFVLERAEVLASIMCMMSILREPPTGSKTNHRAVVGYVMSMCCALLFVWAFAQDAIGRASRGQGLVTNWGQVRRLAVDAFPTDIAMNHIDVVLASYHHASGNSERAKHMILQHMKENPQSMSGMKAWVGMNSSRANSCEALNQIQLTFRED